jgi:hypothetical protein
MHLEELTKITTVPDRFHVRHNTGMHSKVEKRVKGGNGKYIYKNRVAPLKPPKTNWWVMYKIVNVIDIASVNKLHKISIYNQLNDLNDVIRVMKVSYGTVLEIIYYD